MPDTFVLDWCGGKVDPPEPDLAAALRLFERYESGEISLIAPDVLLAECESLLAKRSRRKEISTEQAYEAYHLMTRCAPRLLDTRPRLMRALDLSLRHQLSLWDCVYLALAVEHDCPLLTGDRRLFGAPVVAGTRLLCWSASGMPRQRLVELRLLRFYGHFYG